jgi:hypothetical protein
MRIIYDLLAFVCPSAVVERIRMLKFRSWQALSYCRGFNCATIRIVTI